MKKSLCACAMAFSMFCAVPCPFKVWDEQARPLMPLFLPVVGLFIGAMWTALAFVLRLLDCTNLVGASLLTIAPYVLTGFIHLDGFMDTCDAILSRRDLEERRRILKDPTVGTFAVICFCIVLLLGFSLFASMDRGKAWHVLLLIPVVTRACAGLAVTKLRPMSHSQYSGRKTCAVHTVIMGAEFAVAVFAAFAACGRFGVAVLASGVGYWLAAWYGFSQFDGFSGDISGYALTIGELCGVALLGLL